MNIFLIHYGSFLVAYSKTNCTMVSLMRRDTLLPLIITITPTSSKKLILFLFLALSLIDISSHNPLDHLYSDNLMAEIKQFIPHNIPAVIEVIFVFIVIGIPEIKVMQMALL